MDLIHYNIRFLGGPDKPTFSSWATKIDFKAWGGSISDYVVGYLAILSTLSLCYSQSHYVTTISEEAISRNDLFFAQGQLGLTMLSEHSFIDLKKGFSSVPRVFVDAPYDVSLLCEYVCFSGCLCVCVCMCSCTVTLYKRCFVQSDRDRSLGRAHHCPLVN